MFSKSTTKPIILTVKSEEGTMAYTRYYDLPKKRVLFFTKDNDAKTSTLKIFSMYDLDTIVVEKKIDGDCRLLCIFPDGRILLSQKISDQDKKLFRLCPDTLNIISSQPWMKTAYSAGVIDNHNFFVITAAGNSWQDKNPVHFLTICKWTEDKYAASDPIELEISSRSASHFSNMGTTIHSLGENHYCCEFRGYNTKEFRILIFEVSVDTLKVKELGIIQPKAQYYGRASWASGSYIVLPNHQLLTYHESRDNVQIWDTKTFECVKEWNWAGIKRNEELLPVWSLQIKAFPDSTNLLVFNGSNFFIFNTDKFVMKKIEISSIPENWSINHILPNGKVVMSGDSVFQKKLVKIVHFDLDEMKMLRETINSSQHLSRFFFNSKYLPPEITDHIFSYAFTPDAKATLARKIFTDWK